MAEARSGAADTRVRFTDEHIAFDRYPYPAASVYPHGAVAWADVASVDVDATPPEIRRRDDEVLFVPASDREPLARAAAGHRIPIRRRTDVWALLLEPFLDTEFDADHRERTLACLAASGLQREEVAAIRRAHARRMLAYNATHWAWTHLGLADLLDAYRTGITRWLPGADGRFKTLYDRAMTIAARGRWLEPADARHSAG